MQTPSVYRNMILGFIFLMTPVLLWSQQQMHSRSLADALRALRSKTGLDVVFSSGLLAGKSTTCQIEGLAPEGALRCILQGTGLVAKSTGSTRQWVIVPAAVSPLIQPTAPPQYEASGTVRDAITGETLIGASIIIESAQRGTTTDREGRFKINQISNKNIELRASYVGYESVILEVDLTGKPIDIRLSPSNTSLAQLVVDGHRTEGLSEKATPGVLTLSSRQLEQAGAFRGQEDLFQVLDGFASVGRSSEVNGDLVVRGADEGQVRYMVDDIPLFTPGRTFGGFSTPQTDLLQGVTLYRGLIPAEFGGRLASVLTTSLKDGIGNKPSYSVGLSQSSGRISAELPLLASLSGMLALRHSVQDVLRQQQTLYIQQKNRLQNISAQYGYGDATAKFSFRPSRYHQVSINLYQGSDALSAEGNESLFPQLKKNPEYSTGFSSGLTYGWRSHQAGIRYQFLPSNQIILSVALYHSGYKMTEMNRIGVVKTTGNAVEAFEFYQRASYENEQSEAGIKVRTDVQRGRHTARVGAALVRHELGSVLQGMITNTASGINELPSEDTISGVPKEKSPFAPNQKNFPYHTSQKATEAFVFGEDVLQLGHLQIVPGIRFGIFDRHTFFSPQLSAKLSPTENLALKAGIGSQAQYLHTLRDRLGCAYSVESGGCANLGRLFIRPSHGHQANAGVEWMLHHAFRLEIEAYWRKSGNLLIADRPYRVRDGLEEPLIEAGQQMEKYIPGQNLAFGLESTGYWNLNNHYSATMGYVYGRSYYQLKEASHTLSIPARYDAPHSAYAAVQYRKNGWLTTLSGQIRSGYPVHTEGFSLISMTDPEKMWRSRSPSIERLNTYHRLDISVGKRLNHKGRTYEFTGQLLNFTNTTNDLDQLIDGTGGMYASIHGSGVKPAFNLKISF